MSDEVETEETKRGMDPELRSLGQILRILQEVEEEARARMVRYLSNRFPEGKA